MSLLGGLDQRTDGVVESSVSRLWMELLFPAMSSVIGLISILVLLFTLLLHNVSYSSSLSDGLLSLLRDYRP